MKFLARYFISRYQACVQSSVSHCVISSYHLRPRDGLILAPVVEPGLILVEPLFRNAAVLLDPVEPFYIVVYLTVS